MHLPNHSFTHSFTYSLAPEFLFKAAFNPHATTHGAIGNVFGRDAFKPLYDAGIIRNFDDINAIGTIALAHLLTYSLLIVLAFLAAKWPVVLIKESFRAHKVEPRKNCTVTETGTECSFICNNLDEFEQALKAKVDLYDDLTDDEMETWLTFACSEVGYYHQSLAHSLTHSRTCACRVIKYLLAIIWNLHRRLIPVFGQSTVQ